MAARLKTYWAQIDGLHDWAVAAPNQQAALEAFGVNQNLFAQGEAGISDDPRAVEAAQAHPGHLVRRKAGSGEAYAPAELGGGGWDAALAALPKTRKARPPSRAALDKAQAALDALWARHQEALQALEEERSALDRRRQTLEAEFDEKEDAAREKLDAERERFEAAGGRV